jgi:predicted O-linked N-acetylglucosamine transferase (SPINDLY family)
MRQRLDAAMDRIVDVTHKSDRDVAVLAREMGIDIAIDLLGFNSQNRMPIFAHRAAPVQVNYLGYPGTVCESHDYIIADPTVVTPQSEAHFAEKVVYLPHSYQINDSKRPISERVFTRHELGLPETVFVFCCFNNNYKLTPDVFDVWMRLLQRVEGSVLWLLAGNETATVNLRKEAQKRGVAPERVIFAQRMDLPDHLARHRAADLVVDTFYYGAHTTASDALWAGVPVLTKAGETFASRVGASLLTAVGLPDLITHTVADYEDLAVALATQPERLAALKQRLADNRLTCPLFDTARYARYIETAYLQMWEIYQAGLPPDHIRVGA